jgi:hypothetical protein
MRACSWFAIIVAVAAVAGCSVPGGHEKYVRLQELPPTRAAVIDAALRSYDVPLTVHSSCTSVGDDEDRTVGRYLAQLISLFEIGQDNSVEVRIVPREAPSGRYWRASMMLRTLVSNGDGFYYGVEFLIRQSDGGVIPTSFSCPGLP